MTIIEFVTCFRNYTLNSCGKNVSTFEDSCGKNLVKMCPHVLLLEESILCVNVCGTLLIGSLSFSINFATDQPFKIIDFTIQIDCLLAKARKNLPIMRLEYNFVHYSRMFVKNGHTRFEAQH